MTFSLLYISPPGRLRDSLIVILQSDLRLSPIFIADDIEDGIIIAEDKHPLITIIDCLVPEDSNFHQFQNSNINENLSSIILITNTQEQAKLALSMGVDAVLMKGFSTTTLFSTIFGLLQDNSTIKKNKTQAFTPHSATPNQPAPIPGLT